jgi:hypothetical protein
MSLPVTWVGASDNYTPGRTQPVDMIVMHWMVGTLQSADATFTNPARDGSAHYGVNGQSIHQYVKESDTAWANGHRDPKKNTNPRSISIEHEGGWSIPGGRFKPSPETHEMSARLIADIVSRRPNIKLDRNHIKKHNEVSDTGTECPGSLDVDWIINRAKQLLGGQDMVIIVKPIQPIIAEVKKGIPLFDITTGKEITKSGNWMRLTQKTNIVNGSTYYIPHDRADKGEVFGFKEEEVWAKGNTVNVEPSPANPTPADPVIVEKARKFDEIVNLSRSLRGLTE